MDRPAHAEQRSFEELEGSDDFQRRHIGPDAADQAAMLAALGLDSLDALIDAVVPPAIRAVEPLALGAPRTETEVLAALREIAARNQVFRSYIGMGYADCHTPPVILRNILENPAWYTAYTPYQPEISQGRLEALLNFQTMIADLTGLEIANASMLDEGTAAAEAMAFCRRVSKSAGMKFFVASDCHPQTIEVVRTRAEPLRIDIVTGDPEVDFEPRECFGILLQYPASSGALRDPSAVIARAHAHGALAAVAADLLALTLLKPPGELAADVAVGSAQRFGVPMGYGGPHAGYLATRDAHKRLMPGRLVGVSIDAQGDRAYRLAMQTREQHIRREKATSNICTAQVLLAVIASMYAVWHGPQGLRTIAERVHRLTATLAAGLRRLRCDVAHDAFFDTLTVRTGARAAAVRAAARAHRINLREVDAET
ncbi:MAG: glycine dehydrogenase (aminomethyl-transferring), partial [Betaproteobacteria bacterium]|nr:glycine dehydrogenase (aminomethyl-transferring) [Betaproteobacteria bacterium]